MYVKNKNEFRADLATLSYKPACFAAGTLVHTKEGLKPIEQIKVGDLVLSKSETGEGELSYQPVTRTFEYEDREVYFVSWNVMDSLTGLHTPYDGFMVVTGAHPIWVDRLADIDDQFTDVYAWMSIEAIYELKQKSYWDYTNHYYSRTYITLADGRIASIQFIEPILQSADPNMGVSFRENDTWFQNLQGHAVYFDSAGPRVEYQRSGSYKLADLIGFIDDAAHLDHLYATGRELNFAGDINTPIHTRSGGHPMLHRVYNLEVANTHTYFVGEQGLWVHNTSGVSEFGVAMRPTQPIGVFIGAEPLIRLRQNCRAD